MNMRINQQFLEALSRDAGKNEAAGVKELKGSFGKALATAVKAVPRQEQRQASPGPKEIAVRLVKTENVQPQSGTSDSPKTPEGGQETGLNPNRRPDEKAVGQVKGQSARDKSLISGAIKSEQDANRDEQSWWLELMSLLNFLAQLAEPDASGTKISGMEAAELQVSVPEVAEVQISEIQASGIEVSGMQIHEIDVSGIQVPEVQVSEQQVSGIQIPQLQTAQVQVPGILIPEEQLSGVPVEADPVIVPGVFPSVPNPVSAQLKQAGEQVDIQLVTAPEDTNRTELQKLSAWLKPLLDQLRQGKITLSAAAEMILEAPGLMEQIALQVKLLKFQQPSHGQLTEAAPASGQADLTEENGKAQFIGQVLETGGSGTSKPAVPVELPEMQERPGKPGMVKDNGTLVNPSEKDPAVNNNTGNKEGNEPEGKDGSGSAGHREFSAAGMKTETPFKAPDNLVKLNELEQQPWAVQTGLKNDEQSPEALLKTVRSQRVNTARELATHMIFKQIVHSSQLLVGRDHSEIRIQLRPEFLGKVSLEIAVEQGIVKAEIAAENQQVKQLIEANLGNLKQNLTNQGLRVDQLVVNLGQGQSQFGQTKGESRQPGRSSSRRSQDGEMAFEVGEVSGEYGGHLTGENRVVDYKI